MRRSEVPRVRSIAFVQKSINRSICVGFTRPRIDYLFQHYRFFLVFARTACYQLWRLRNALAHTRVPHTQKRSYPEKMHKIFTRQPAVPDFHSPFSVPLLHTHVREIYIAQLFTRKMHTIFSTASFAGTSLPTLESFFTNSSLSLRQEHVKDSFVAACSPPTKPTPIKCSRQDKQKLNIKFPFISTISL